jgi:hypothetical protein
MLPMPRIVRPDPFGIGSPVDPALAESLSETKNCGEFEMANELVKSRTVRRGTTSR